MIKEAFALLLGFTLLSFSGKLIYKGFCKITRRFSGENSNFSSYDPAALMLTGFSLATLFILLLSLIHI